MSRFTLLLGGDLTPTRAVLDLVGGSRVIAADAGMRHAATLGVVPELWVGDFDSAPDDLPEHLLAIPREAFPRDKDKTDGELAADIALARGATALVLAGAFGGPRCDHEFLHLTLAIRLMEAGIGVVLTSGGQEGHPLPHGEMAFDHADGALFSIIAFTDLEGLTVKGARWPLASVDTTFGSSLTISNAVNGRLRVRLNGGRAMLIANFDENQRDRKD